MSYTNCILWADAHHDYIQGPAAVAGGQYLSIYLGPDL